MKGSWAKMGECDGGTLERMTYRAKTFFMCLFCVRKPRLEAAGPAASAAALTSREHHTDRENHLHVSVGGHVAEADGDEASEHEIEGGGIAALQIQVTKKAKLEGRRRRTFILSLGRWLDLQAMWHRRDFFWTDGL